MTADQDLFRLAYFASVVEAHTGLAAIKGSRRDQLDAAVRSLREAAVGRFDWMATHRFRPDQELSRLRSKRAGSGGR